MVSEKMSCQVTSKTLSELDRFFMSTLPPRLPIAIPDIKELKKVCSTLYWLR